MKRFISAAFAAAALLTVTGCEGRHSEPVTEVSTSDTSAGMTSNYTSQSFQAEPVTTAAETAAVAVSAAATSVTSSNTIVNTVEVPDVQTVSSEQPKPASTRTTTAKAPSTSKPSAGTSAAETTTVQLVTTTTAAESTQIQEPTTRPAPTREDVLTAYKGAVSDMIDTLQAGEPDTISVSYTLFDLSGNGIPELIVKCETDDNYIQDAIYKYDEFGLKVIASGVLGTNTDFAWDPEAKKFVSVYSNAGEGELTWFGYDDSEVDQLKSTRFVYGSDEPLEVQLENNGVKMLPFARYTNSYVEVTWIYKISGSGLEYEETLGRDFSFFDRYEF